MIDPAAFIRDRLPLAPVPGIAEIRLHKATPSSGLHLLAAQDRDGFGSPYWAYHWGGGLVLARHVLDHPACVAGLRVMDLGCGSGIVAIVAALAGATRVRAVDVDRYAVIATGLNAAANGVAIDVVQEDPLDGPVPPVDALLVGDLFYAPDLARRVTAFLERCVASGITVLVGDPGRAPLPRERLQCVAESEICETESTAKMAAVFTFLNIRSD